MPKLEILIEDSEPNKTQLEAKHKLDKLQFEESLAKFESALYPRGEDVEFHVETSAIPKGKDAEHIALNSQPSKKRAYAS